MSLTIEQRTLSLYFGYLRASQSLPKNIRRKIRLNFRHTVELHMYLNSTPSSNENFLAKAELYFPMHQKLLHTLHEKGPEFLQQETFFNRPF
mmetsp:Transcript_11737/g.17426  ORF Transcript_11737/g.17426 Transcript_11737/m.17426 type:complete len:92 (-) Transcript_11737:521-796(-)